MRKMSGIRIDNLYDISQICAAGFESVWRKRRRDMDASLLLFQVNVSAKNTNDGPFIIVSSLLCANAT